MADPTGPSWKTVTFHVLRCPSCHSDAVRTVSTQRPIRRHKCKRCGRPFKSVEDMRENRGAGLRS